MHHVPVAHDGKLGDVQFHQLLQLQSDLMTLEADDIRASRVFKEGKLDLDGDEGANDVSA